MPSDELQMRDSSPIYTCPKCELSRPSGVFSRANLNLLSYVSDLGPSPSLDIIVKGLGNCLGRLLIMGLHIYFIISMGRLLFLEIKFPLYYFAVG